MIDIISFVFCYQLVDEKIIILPKMIDVFRDTFNRACYVILNTHANINSSKNLLNNTVIHFVVF